ncbi:MULTISPECIES: glutamine amidotransferase [Acinetobacter]|uniref:glutamine amidotransferase n=1 Tax=Acinetobacter TaxID=469 RepID=UPI001BB7BE97|nr:MULTISPECIES: glutamine amidotransferase [Acinetobacter]MCU4366277.1 glutamine amidotransferase [Acinetobacter variabilis]MCU4376249.1 glutamine amidotransferase [Acinetobacter variabilis]UXI50360.1 glutamine amidotransferase [Acinetobacter variabilis]BCT89466.1 GMP synthase [Acinetobacter variabilis]
MLNLDHFPDTVYAIQHLAFEDLGAWEDVFYQLGLRVRYFEAGIDDLRKAYEYKGLTIILGGPIGVYETVDYPFLQQEIDLLKVRLEKNLPTLGICLGTQLIAHALGAKVYAGHSKEIGWSKLTLPVAENNPLQALENIEVLHWHGDTFDLPEQAELLASSDLYPNQAFRVGQNILALQFHAEVASESLEKWLIGHTCELRKAQINIPTLRADHQSYAPALEQAASSVLMHYLENLQLK